MSGQTHAVASLFGHPDYSVTLSQRRRAGETRNAWQSLASSPRGIAVTPLWRIGETKLSSDRSRKLSTDPQGLAVKRT